MNFFYVIVDYGEDIVVFPCKYNREAMELASTKRKLFPTADVIITKTIYSELKVKVDV